VGRGWGERRKFNGVGEGSGIGGGLDLEWNVGVRFGLNTDFWGIVWMCLWRVKISNGVGEGVSEDGDWNSEGSRDYAGKRSTMVDRRAS
jgi:hypothetical protein